MTVLGTGWKAELDVALKAVRAASRICQRVQAQEIDFATKSDKSPVTVADYASQAVVCKELKTAFPDDPIVAEEDSGTLRGPESALLPRVQEHVCGETGPASSEQVLSWIDQGGTSSGGSRFWTLDPIDGTKGFLRKEQFAVALGLIVDGSPVLAALACPNLGAANVWPNVAGTIYLAIVGQGAWMLPLTAEAIAPLRINVTSNQNPAFARMTESVESGHSDQGHSAQVVKSLGFAAEPVRMDSQAKYAVVARGDADCYLRLPTRADYREKIWDHAAGWLVVTEAGGTVTDIDGLPLDFSLGRELTQNRGVVVTGGAWHSQVLKAVKQVLTVG